ncbi:MAG: hypothetical protein AAF766_04775 [Cyanobacteria bacterium P01_D01_bin.14]
MSPFYASTVLSIVALSIELGDTPSAVKTSRPSVRSQGILN